MLLVVAMLPSCARNPETSSYEKAAQASHQRMIQELDQVEHSVNEENLYLGDGRLKETQKKVNELSPEASPEVRGTALGYLGWYQLCYGLESEAIASLEQARSFFARRPGERRHPELEVIEGTLTLAYIRLAETQNCCAQPNPDSCIFPVRGGGIHDRKEGAEKAFELLRQSISSRSPGEWVQYEEKWLINIALTILGRSTDEIPGAWRLPDPYINPEPSGFPEFENIAEKAGVNTFGLSGGAVADDFDGDGFIDLIVSQWDPAQGMKYFRGKGDNTFEEVTSHSNLESMRGGLNIKQGDFDNDGDLDLYVMRGAWMGRFGDHPNSLLRNNGVNGEGFVTFTDVTFAVGLGEPFYPSQSGDWTDFDLDGDLDLFVAGESKDDLVPCQLFRNDGTGEEGIPRFVDVAEEAGVQTFRYVKGAVWGDYDGDRFPDLFLSCLNNENVLWRNRGDGTFEDVTSSTGTAQPERSFPTWFWDYNNDGLLDLFVSDYSGLGAKTFLQAWGAPIRDPSLCRLYRNDGNGKFQRAEVAAGLVMPMNPMGCNFGDLTNDGYPDIYLGTGDTGVSAIVPNLLITNENGRFADRTVESRLGHLQKGHAISFADFDRDGDLDIFAQMGGAFRCDPYYDALFENPGRKGNHWLSIRLKGRDSNRFGVGSRVRVVVMENDEERSLYQWMNSGSSFGANPLELHFGLGKAREIERVEVFWPASGKTQVVRSVLTNERIVIEEE